MRRAIVVFALALASCGSPQQLPLSIPRCDAVRTSRGVALTASVKNTAAKPISSLAIAVEFYRDFRSARLTGGAQLRKPIAPGEQRDVNFDVGASNSQVEGRAMRCFATHISYVDGSSQDVAPSR